MEQIHLYIQHYSNSIMINLWFYEVSNIVVEFQSLYDT
jgi:hypothetical protein